MKLKKKITGFAVLCSIFLILQNLPCKAYMRKSAGNDQDSSITVPVGGNSWRLDKDTLGGNISNDGIVNWTDKKAAFVTYVRFAKKGSFKLYLSLKVPVGKTVLSVTALNKTREITVD